MRGDGSQAGPAPTGYFRHPGGQPGPTGKPFRDCRSADVAWPRHDDQFHRRSGGPRRPVPHRHADPGSDAGRCGACLDHRISATVAAVRPPGVACACRQHGLRDDRDAVRTAVSAGDPANHRRADRRRRPRRALAAGRRAAGTGDLRSRPVLGAADALRPADDAGRGDDAGRDLRAPATASGVVPRSLAGRTADVQGGVRSVDHPPVHRLRSGLPDRESHHLRGRVW